MQLQALERRPGDDFAPPPPRRDDYGGGGGAGKRYADLDDKEKAERDAKTADYLRSRKTQRLARPIPNIWARSPSPEHCRSAKLQYVPTK